MRNHILAYRKRKGSAKVSIKSWLSYFDVRMNHVEVRGGQDMLLKVQPVHHYATDAFRALYPEKRHCLFAEELDTDMDGLFNKYDERACHFDCRMRYAVGKSGCVPWDYPAFENDALPICTSLPPNRLSAFERAMNSNESLQGCRCLPDCQQVLFKTQETVFPLDLDELCDPHGDWAAIDLVMSDWRRRHSPVAYWADRLSEASQSASGKRAAFGDIHAFYANLSYGLPTEQVVDVCKSIYANDMVRLRVQIADSNVLQIKKDVRVRFSDQLGMIGGTLGLFTGMSIISLVEILFWGYKVCIFFETLRR